MLNTFLGDNKVSYNFTFNMQPQRGKNSQQQQQQQKNGSIQIKHMLKPAKRFPTDINVVQFLPFDVFYPI